jgi:hypothetical protein
MKRTRIALVTAVVMAASLVAGSVNAGEPSIKQLMGENFAGLQTILVSLIASDYRNIPAQADVIADHATRLTQGVPKSAEAQKDRFLALAFALKVNAESMKSISEALMQHDQEHAGNVLAVDALRESLAGHYAGMVVTCVSCHNQFRPTKLAPQ